MMWKSTGVLFAGWVLLFVWLVGCATVPKSPENPYLGYVYNLSIKGDTKFKQDGVESALSGYREQIASQELQRRKKTYNSNDRSISKTEEYIALLEKPVLIDEEDRWRGDLARLDKKEKKAVLAYWEANKPLSFNGGEASREWHLAYLNVTKQLESDIRNANEAESEIKSLRKQNRFRDALGKVEKLRPYKPGEAEELERSLKNEASKYWIGMRMQEIGELRNASVYDGKHEERILELYGKVCADVEVFGSRGDFNGVFAAWQDLLGENWRRRIEEMGKNKAYWEAYEFARERYFKYVKTLRFAKSYREGLRVKIGDGYLSILDGAIRYYTDLASDAYQKQSQGGKAYVYCCMAKEMYDFRTVANLGVNKEAKKWYKIITALEKNDLVPSLGSRVARRLVVLDFDMDILGLSKKLRQSCREKYVPGNNHAFGLEVVLDKVALAQFEDGSLPLEPDDYLVEWNKADFKVKRTYGTPLPETVYVRTDRIKLIDNPNEFRKKKSSKFYKMKKVKVQEVDQYSLIESVKGMNLSCDMDVICQHRGSKRKFRLNNVKASVDNIMKKYGSVTNITSTCSLENVVSKMEYYSSDQDNNTIPRDTPPSNYVLPIPDEDRLKEALTVSIIQDIDGELKSLIDLYPVELLADADRGESSAYLDALGTTLFYIANLSSAEAAKRESAGKGYEWIPLRDQIADNTKEWCGRGERWGSVGADEKKLLRSLWEECVKVGNEQDDR